MPVAGRCRPLVLRVGKVVVGWRSVLARIVGVVVPVFLLSLMSMGHCSEQRPGFEVTKDWNGAYQVVIQSPWAASVRVSLHGGRVISWRNERREELLFTSGK